MFFLVFCFFQTKKTPRTTTSFFPPEIVAWVDKPSHTWKTSRRIGRYSVPMKPSIPRRERVWWICGAKTLKGPGLGEKGKGTIGGICEATPVDSRKGNGCKLSFLSFEFSWILEKSKYVYSVLWMIFWKLQYVPHEFFQSFVYIKSISPIHFHVWRKNHRDKDTLEITGALVNPHLA